MLQRVEVVRDHAATALSNALEHNNVFLMPLWRAVGRLKWIIKGRALPKTIAISAAVLVTILILCFYPVDFDIEARGQLQPAERRAGVSRKQATRQWRVVPANGRARDGPPRTFERSRIA